MSIWTSLSDIPVHKIKIVSENKDILLDKNGFYMIRYIREGNGDKTNFGNSGSIYRTELEAWKSFSSLIEEQFILTKQKMKENTETYKRDVIKINKRLSELRGNNE